MLAIFLALAAAISFGGSDYTAGLVARQAGVLSVSVTAEVAKAVLILAIVPFVSSQSPTTPALLWGAVAGVSGAGGVMVLFLGFRYAAFSVASSVSAVSAAGVSVLVGLLYGERPGALALAGIALTIPAILTVTASSGRSGATSQHLAGVVCGLVAGAGFALSLVSLNRAGSDTDLWPLVTAELAAVATMTGIARANGQLRLPPARARTLALVAGIIAAAGTFSYFLATHRGPLAVTAVIYSLYPAGTIVLARAVSREQLTTVRIIGLCLAAASVGLIAATAALPL
jgi:drug/metabolite transporter (DMT)-like permease